MYGYGALLGNSQKANHCFSINFQDNSNLNSIEDVLKEYRNAIRLVRLYGPTFFAPMIRKTIEHRDLQKNENVYFILMILTDGIINDMKDTIDALVDASFLPISIIIIGIGNADFSNMDVLDADVNPLYNSSNVKTARDIVQFVPFNKFKNDGKKLAEEVLKEIPRQIEGYLRMYNIEPGNNNWEKTKKYLV